MTSRAQSLLLEPQRPSRPLVVHDRRLRERTEKRTSVSFHVLLASFLP